MIDETSGIIGWPIGQQYKELAVRDEASTTTWETLVEQYRERAKRDDARIDELRQSTEHWHDTAQMLKRQRDTAEEDRDGWKIRAMQSEQQRQALRAECDALRKNAARLDYLADQPVFEGFADSPLDVFELESIVAEQNGRSEPTQADRREAFRRMIDAAMAVQPTTGGGDE